jgi:hypothetical protein
MTGLGSPHIDGWKTDRSETLNEIRLSLFKTSKFAEELLKYGTKVEQKMRGFPLIRFIQNPLPIV